MNRGGWGGGGGEGVGNAGRHLEQQKKETLSSSSILFIHTVT